MLLQMQRLIGGMLIMIVVVVEMVVEVCTRVCWCASQLHAVAGGAVV